MATVIIVLVLIAVIVVVLTRRGASKTTASPDGRAQHASRPEAPRDGTPPDDRSAGTARTQFARPGLVGPMFHYGGTDDRSLTHSLGGPFAVIDFQTTGLSSRSDRIIEVAVVRVEPDGTIGEPWSTLVNPKRDTGASFIHHISNEQVADAPTFEEIAPYLLSLLDGTIVVAHSATFDEAFLSAELSRMGRSGLRMPAVCTLWLAQTTRPDLRNHKLPTLARELGLSMTNYVSRDHVLATAEVLTHTISRLPAALRYGCAPYRWDGGDVPPPRVKNRVRGLRKGADGYMSSLMSRLPSVASEGGDAEADAYLEALGVVMEDGQVDRQEAELLADLAGSAGMSRSQVAALSERFLETMREAALEDDVLTATELRELKRAAKALGVPTYFDDLAPTQRTSGSPAVHAPSARKCGQCGETGHYRPTCPQLIAAN